MVNIIFLIIGLILGFTFGYLLERIREGRVREKSAHVLRNEIEILCEDIETDFKAVESAKKLEKSTGILKEKLYLSAYFLSSSMYGIDAYESYLDKIYLFQSNTQKAIMGFYTVIKKIKRDLGSIQPTLKIKDIPYQLIKDLYKKQHELREQSLEKAKLCIKELGKEKKLDMRKCKRNIILIFGYLLIVAILFIPYTKPYAKYTEKKGWQKKDGFMFTPIFIYKLFNPEKSEYEYILDKKPPEFSEEVDKFMEEEEYKKLTKSDIRKYKLRLEFFICELAIVLLIGIFTYILFCVVLRKYERE